MPDASALFEGADVSVPTCHVQATTLLRLTGNLDPDDPPPLNVQMPSLESNLTVNTQVYDATGARHTVQILFSSSTAGRWEFEVLVTDSVELMSLGSGLLEFDANGALMSEIVTRTPIRFPGTSTDQIVALGFGTPTSLGGSGTDGVTGNIAPDSIIVASVDGASCPPCLNVATTSIAVVGNLNSNDVPPMAPWDAQAPAYTSNFSTSMSIFDGFGGAHPMSVYFAQSSYDRWTYHAVVDSSDVQGGTPGLTTEIATGILFFNASGSLDSNSLIAGGLVSFVGGAANQGLTFDFGTVVGAGGTGLDGITSFGSPDEVSEQVVNGDNCPPPAGQ